MTRKEAKEAIKEAYGNSEYTDEIIKALEQEHCEMTAEEYRQRVIRAFHNSDCDELIAVCVLPTEKEFEHLEWLLKNHYKKESCDDAVSRKALHKELYEHFHDEDALNNTTYVTLGSVRNFVKDFPPVTPTRKKGKWIKVTETEFGIGYKCSECGRFILTESIDERKLKDYPYCHCGAEMRGVEE